MASRGSSFMRRMVTEWRDGFNAGSGGFRERGCNVGAMWIRVLGLCAAVFAVGFEVDFGGRTNELGRSLVFVGFGYGFGLGLGFSFGNALRLEFLELAEGFFQRALQALLIEAEVDEGFGIGAEDGG